MLQRSLCGREAWGAKEISNRVRMLKWLRLVCRQPWTLRWCSCHPGGPLETVLAGQEDEADRNIGAVPGKKLEQVLCNKVSTAISSTAL